MISAAAGSGDFSGDYGIRHTFEGTEHRVRMNDGAMVSDARPAAARTASNVRMGMSQSGNATMALSGFIDALYCGWTKTHDAQLQALAVEHLAA